MKWYTSALLSAVMFAAMNLIFRWLFSRGINTSIILLFVFGLNFLLYAAGRALYGGEVTYTTSIVVALVLASILSSVGNLLALRSMESAPNPGYALALSNSQVFIVAIAAVFIFGAHFSITKLCGVLLCLAGIVLLSL